MEVNCQGLRMSEAKQLVMYNCWMQDISLFNHDSDVSLELLVEDVSPLVVLKM
jgi:hypothetical protein